MHLEEVVESSLPSMDALLSRKRINTLVDELREEVQKKVYVGKDAFESFDFTKAIEDARADAKAKYSKIATENHNAIKQGPPQEVKIPSTPCYDDVVKSDVQALTGSTSTLNHGSWTEEMYEQNLADFSNRIDPSLQNEGPDYGEFCSCIRSVSGIPVAPTNYYLRDYRRFMDVLCKHTAQFWVDFKFKRTVDKKDFHHSMRNLSTWFRSQSDSENYWGRFVKTLLTNGVLCKADAYELIKYPDEITEAEPTAVLPPCDPSDAGLIDLTNDQTEDDVGPGPNRGAGTANSVSAYKIYQQAAAAAESFTSEQKKYLDSLDFRTDVVVGILLCHNINIPAFEKTLESNTEFRRKLRVFVQAACGV